MDDMWGQLQGAFWALIDKLGTFCGEALDAAGRKGLELLASLADALDRLAAKLAAVPWWISLPALLLLLSGWLTYLFRQRLYDRVLVYHSVWLKRQGFARHVFTVRRGAVRETREAMARRVPLSDRFPTVALYEVHPARYAVAYGPAGDWLEDWRLYRRDRRAGLRAMGEDLMGYFRVNVRLLHADSELRALFAELDAVDADFAACRPLLPGEVREPVWGVTLPSRREPERLALDAWLRRVCRPVGRCLAASWHHAALQSKN